jgi:hypothetical protein
VLKIGGPLTGERSRSVVRQSFMLVRHLRIIAARLLPRNISNSEP